MGPKAMDGMRESAENPSAVTGYAHRRSRPSEWKERCVDSHHRARNVLPALSGTEVKVALGPYAVQKMGTPIGSEPVKILRIAPPISP